MDKNFNEGKKKIKDKPDVDHLDVGRFRQVVGDIDEHGGQHKHCLKKKNNFTIMAPYLSGSQLLLLQRRRV